MNKDTDIQNRRMSNHRIKQLFRRLTIVLSVIAVVFISYALTLPANTLEHGTFKVESGQTDQKTLSSEVHASAGKEKEESYFVFVYDPEQIQLDIAFDDNDEAIIEDDNLSKVTLHKETVIIDEDTNEAKDTYWFTLKKGNETEFTVDWISQTESVSDDIDIHYAFSYSFFETVTEAEKEENKLTIDLTDTGSAVVDNADASQPLAGEASASAAEEETNVTSRRSIIRKSSSRSTNTDDTRTTGTPSEFGQYIISATIYKNENGTWKEQKEFENGDQIKAVINFTLPIGVVTKENNTITYQLPDGIILDYEESGPVDDGKGNYIGDYIISESGLITIIYNNAFATSEGFDGDIQFEGKLSVSDNTKDNEIIFEGNGGSITVKKEEQSEFDIQTDKQAVKLDDGRIRYTITTSTTKGTEDTVTIKDNLYGSSDGKTKPKYSDDFKIYDSNNNEITSQYSVNMYTDGYGFEIAGLPKLNARQKYTVTYTVTPGENENGYSVVRNTAVSASKYENKSKSVNTEISKQMVSKYGWFDDKTNQITWTITINEDQKDLAGWTLSDTVTSVNGIQVQLPSTFTLKDSSGNSREITLINGSYMFPDTYDNNTYTIQYTTPVSFEDQNSGNVTNTITLKDKEENEYYADWNVTGITKRDWSVSKSALSNTTSSTAGYRDFKWSSAVKIPVSDAFQEFTFTDTLGDVTDASGGKLDREHYAILSELQSSLQNSLKLNYIDTDGSYRYLSYDNDKFDFTIQYYDSEGNEVTDLSSKVKKYTITVSPKGNVHLSSVYEMIIGSYTTHAQMEGIKTGETWSVGNTCQVNDKTAAAAGSYTKPRPIIKQGGFTNEWGIEYSEENISVDMDVETKTAILYYQLLLDFDSLDNQQIIIEDTLPEGTELNTSEETACGYDVKGGYYKDKYTQVFESDWRGYNFNKNENDRNTALSVSLEKQTDGTQKLMITIQPGYKDNASNNYISIRYSLTVNDDYWTSLKHEKKDYVNTVALDDYSTSQTTTVIREVPKVEKTGKQLYAKNIAGEDVLSDQIQYTVVINPSGSDLNPNEDTLDLVDTLTWTNASVENAYLDLDGTKLFLYDESKTDHIGSEVTSERYALKYDQDAHTMTASVPDELACVLVYTYTFDPGNAESFDVNNAVALLGNKYHSEEIKSFQTSESSSTATRGSLTIYKVDSDNYMKRLSDAKFIIEFFDMKANSQIEGSDLMNSGTKTWQVPSLCDYLSDGKEIDLSDDEGYYPVDENGELTISASDGDSYVDVLRSNVLYRITEAESPEGYQLDKTPKYFVMLKDGMTLSEVIDDMRDVVAEVNRSLPDSEKIYMNDTSTSKQNVLFYDITKSNTMYFENNYTNLTVSKVWTDLNGDELDDHPDSVQVQLLQKTSTLSGYSVTLTSSGTDQSGNEKAEYGQKFSCDQNLIVEKGSSITVKVYDWSGQSKYSISVNGGKETYLTPSGNNDGIYQAMIGSITKDDTVIKIRNYYWCNQWWNLGLDESKNVNVTYTSASTYVTTSSSIYDTVTLNSKNNWTKTWSNLPTENDDGELLYYSVQETVPSGYIAAYTNNNGIQKGDICITNKLTDFSLPKTGGKGSALFTTGGLSLCITSVLLYVYMKKKHLLRKDN